MFKGLQGGKMKKKHKVLVLAGGGIFGIIVAKFLSFLGDNFINRIDTLSGCSIGGILASCYAVGAKTDDVLNSFIVGGDDIFSKRLAAKINPLSAPTYSNTELKRFISNYTKDYTIGDIKKIFPHLNVIVPTLNITDDEYKVFDNINKSEDDDLKLQTLSLMTSAAPSYFDGVEYKGKCIVDGGLIQVIPLLTTATTLKSKLGIQFKDMDVLIVCTGNLIDKQPITYQKYQKYNMLDICLNVVVPYATLSNELATKSWGEQMGFNSFELFNPIQIWGGMDQTQNIDTILQDCEMYKTKFLRAWHNFLI